MRHKTGRSEAKVVNDEILTPVDLRNGKKLMPANPFRFSER
jgi:hypothetical protein